jgi:broad specificity phosphatase PhoE
MLTRFTLLVALLLLSLGSAANAQRLTTVILVRHAEKAAQPANDPPLTAEGEARARALVEVARDAGVTAVITTPFARARGTARPLAGALGLTPEVVDPRGAQHPKQVADLIRTKYAGGVVLVVGHSNTIPAIVAALGAKEPPPICDDEYDDIFVVTIPESGPARVVRARYGVPTPHTAGCANTMK